MAKKRVLLGMSGGIDSSVAAILLQKQGYDVIGCTFNFFGNLGKGNDELDGKSIEDFSKTLGIKHYFFDLKNEFSNSVIRYFSDSYLKGETPFPCAECNPKVKWKNMLKYAEILDCNFIASGHYVIKGEYNNRQYIFKGKDPDKDQSFFLWGLSNNTIERSLFPLGSYYKSEIREIALNNGFDVLSRKKDSLGICFIKGANYRPFLKDLFAQKGIIVESGNYIDINKNVLGKHEGYPFYTIGQRHGLNINFNKPFFVSEIKPDSNEIVLSEYDDLFKTGLELRDIHFLDSNEMKSEKLYTIKVRYRNQHNTCTVKLIEKSKALVYLNEPLSAVAAGQTAVFYDKNRVVGGGFIKHSF
jgi:tRNA-specific 2-thiouridylase